MSFSGRSPVSRRCLLASALAISAPGVARADHGGSRLHEAVTRGGLRCSVLASLSPPVPGDPRPQRLLIDEYTLAIAEMVAADLGLRAEILPSSGGRVLGDVAEGRADIGLIPLVVPSTLRQAMFATPITTVDVPVLGIGSRRRNWAQLAGRRVGTMFNYAQAMQDFDLAPTAVEFVPTDTLPKLEAMLRARDIDDVMVNRWHLRNLRERNADIPLTQHFVAMTMPHGIAVAHGEHDLLRALNAVLALARHGGRLAHLHRQYFGVPSPDLDLL